MSIALVLGGGKKVWLEAKKAFTDFDIDYVIAINNCIADYPGDIDAAISLHPSYLKNWLDTRKKINKGCMPINVIAHKSGDRKGEYSYINNVMSYMWPEMVYSGSSGLFAVKAAFEIYNCDKVILAGIPMESKDAHYHNGRTWQDADSFKQAWIDCKHRLDGKVKSYAGWTADLLGTPKDWQ